MSVAMPGAESDIRASEFCVHRYEVVQVSVRNIVSLSVADAIAATNALNLQNILDRDIPLLDRKPGVSKVRFCNLPPLSFTVEPVIDGMSDFRGQMHFGENAAGRPYPLPESLMLKTTESTRLVEKICSISPSAINDTNAKNILMAVLNDAIRIRKLHGGTL